MLTKKQLQQLNELLSQANNNQLNNIRAQILNVQLEKSIFRK